MHCFFLFNISRISHEYACIEKGGLSMRAYLILIGFLFFISACHRSCLIIKKVTSQSTIAPDALCQTPSITVVIHGTKLFIGSFYLNYFDGKPQIKHASALPAAKCSSKFLKDVASCPSNAFPYKDLYYFGWSGLISVKEHNKAAEALYDQLVVLSNQYYQKYHVKPHIRIVGHSHGGNLGLRLGLFHARKQKDILIDELVMLATPVHRTTAQFGYSPLFKNIYSFYACLDCFQAIAPEICESIYDDTGTLVLNKRRGYLFSGQTFPTYIPIKQARIKKDGHTITHSDFMTKEFFCALPALIRKVDKAYKKYGDDIKNGKELLCSIY